MTRLKKYLAFLLVTAMILACGVGIGLLPAFAETDPPAEEAVTEETTEAPEEEPTEATEPTEPKQEETQAPAVEETEPVEIVEEVPEEELTYREVKADAVAEPLYYYDKSKKKHRTTAHQMLVQFWNALMGRPASVEENDLGLKVIVSGELPKDVTAEFRVIAFNEEPINTEEGLVSGELTLRDGEGHIYSPAEPVTVTIKGKALKQEIKDDSALLLYSYQLAPKRAEKYTKKYKKSFYAANVDVYKSDTVDDSLLNYKPYKKNKKYKKGADAVRYTEADFGLLCEKNSVSFEYDYANNKTGTANLVLTAQQAERTLKATSGKAKITVTGALDKDVDLEVSEIDSKSADYKAYVEQTAQTLGTEASSFAFARAFDIKLIDSRSGQEFHPDDDVQVSIKLKDEDINDESKVNVVHFDESASASAEAADSAKAGQSGKKGKSGKHRNLGKPERMKSYTEGNTVEFTAEGFSVYVVTGSDGETVTPQCTYTFWIPSGNEGEYTEYPLKNDQGGTVYTQTITTGEELVVPQMTSTESKVFSGWYEGKRGTDGNVALIVKPGKTEPEPYDFDNISITENSAVDLYAGYKTYATVYFHDLCDSESGDYPVAYTRKAELPTTGEGATATVKINDLSLSNTSYDGREMGFLGWSYTQVPTPGVYEDENHRPYVIDTSTTNGCITVTGETHLYPIFKGHHLLTFYAAPSGQGAVYNGPRYLQEGESLSSLPITSVDGYTFTGWWTGR